MTKVPAEKHALSLRALRERVGVRVKNYRAGLERVRAYPWSITHTTTHRFPADAVLGARRRTPSGP